MNSEHLEYHFCSAPATGSRACLDGNLFQAGGNFKDFWPTDWEWEPKGMYVSNTFQTSQCLKRTFSESFF